MAEGRPFLAFELVAGRTLRELIDGGLAAALVQDIGRQIAKALGVAHAAGIVHRDIKPENVMVRQDGYVKVLDFGLARLHPLEAGPEPLATGTNRLIGTARYMSPEQARGDRIGPPSDVFSLGIMLHQMAYGKHPFPASSLLRTLDAIVHAAPEPVPREFDGLPTTLVTTIEAALDKDPARPSTAAEIDAALAPHPPSFPTRTQPPNSWLRRAPRRLGMAGAMALAVAGNRQLSEWSSSRRADRQGRRGTRRFRERNRRTSVRRDVARGVGCSARAIPVSQGHGRRNRASEPSSDGVLQATESRTRSPAKTP